MSLIRPKSGIAVKWGERRGVLISFLGLALLSSCSDIQRPKTQPFFAENTPPTIQEFRWSNGKMPKSFDPTRAAAAPETDIVRALFEGLTEIDARTLKEIPAAAESWTSSDNSCVWTFNLRKDARWSNGKRVTSYDFVMSWKRLTTLGERAAHRELFQNIVGMQTLKTATAVPGEPTDFLHTPAVNPVKQSHNDLSNTASSAKPQTSIPLSPPSNVVPAAKPEKIAAKKQAEAKFGVEAIDDLTLKVSLELPDKDFPKLVANPIFRPIYGDGVEFETIPLDDEVVTNGAFTVASVDNDGVAIDRSDTYWNRATVNLEHVRFVPKDSAEAALDAYKKGEIDAVTNADFEPLALKLLTPYEDFRRTTHSALNFYEFNTKNPPFSDRRVREALAIAIDRQRLTDSELEGSTEPATSFLPLVDNQSAELVLDIVKAKQLLEKAGYPNGTGFPPIRLLLNRNDTQMRVARVVAKMWKQNLNLETEITVKEPSEIENARALGEYDLVRRGVVLPTVDEAVSMTAIFGSQQKAESPPTVLPKGSEKTYPLTAKSPSQRPIENAQPEAKPSAEHTDLAPDRILTEDVAVFEVNAIPLYYPKSYSLIKPYVNGFEMNGLDAPQLVDISIDSTWQPNRP